MSSTRVNADGTIEVFGSALPRGPDGSGTDLSLVNQHKNTTKQQRASLAQAFTKIGLGQTHYVQSLAVRPDIVATIKAGPPVAEPPSTIAGIPTRTVAIGVGVLAAIGLGLYIAGRK